MKKKLIATSLVVAMLAIAVIGGSLAYFTDNDSATNTFTVGNVKIDLLESTLHRENAGVPNGSTSKSELWSDVEMLGTPDSKYKAGNVCYTDEQIIANAKNYLAVLAENNKLNPGESYHKMPYVLNTGKNDAYVRIRVMIPTELDTAILNSSMYTSTAMLKGEFTMETKAGYTYGGKSYTAYEFTRVEPLAPNEMTYWNVWGTVHMDADVTNDEIAELLPNGTFDVLVQADAIQADGFDNAAAAWAAFAAE